MLCWPNGTCRPGQACRVCEAWDVVGVLVSVGARWLTSNFGSSTAPPRAAARAARALGCAGAASGAGAGPAAPPGASASWSLQGLARSSRSSSHRPASYSLCTQLQSLPHALATVRSSSSAWSWSWRAGLTPAAPPATRPSRKRCLLSRRGAGPGGEGAGDAATAAAAPAAEAAAAPRGSTDLDLLRLRLASAVRALRAKRAARAALEPQAAAPRPDMKRADAAAK